MSTTKQISIFIAEDHLISRMGLKMLLQQTVSFDVVGEAEDGESAVQQVLELKPEVVMMDLEMPKMGGVEATAIIKKELPQTKVLMFTSVDDDASIFAALKAGADGYCLKTISGELLSIAIQSVLNGAAWLDPGIAHKVLRAQSSPQVEDKPDLSESKLKLLSLIGAGKNVDEIAAELNVNDALAKGLLNELLNQLKGTSADVQESSRQPFTAVKDGDVIGGHYRIDYKLGEGGMGCVYQATHTIIDRKVAIKMLHETVAAGEVNRERFKTEAKASAAVIHPNLVTIFDFGLVDDKIPYLVMEYLEGQSLDSLVHGGKRLSAQTAGTIFAYVCDALHAIHAKGIVHRDLKPSNIMVAARDDGSHIVKLVDFGIAKIQAGSAALTATGAAIGTPLFMSPEQCQGTPIDHRSDLYSLGCTMYTTLAGQPPFRGATAMETCMMHLCKEPDSKPLEAAGLSRERIEVVLALMEKDPEKRPSSAEVVKQTLLKA